VDAEGLAPLHAKIVVVDHPLRATGALPLSVWRSAAVIAILVATVELVLLVVAGVALLTRHGSSSTSTAPAHMTATKPAGPAAAHRVTPHRATAPAAKLSRGNVRVVVLNGNGRPGAAAAGASRVRHHGYRVGLVGNAARMSYARSIVMYRPGFEGEGRRLARDLGVKLVGPLDGMRASELQGAQTVLILGA
jgi:hypothetical protein